MFVSVPIEAVVFEIYPILCKSYVLQKYIDLNVFSFICLSKGSRPTDIGADRICSFENTYEYTIFKIETLTLEMYCGLHFQFRRAHYHS
jgi:hypothetical protein